MVERELQHRDYRAKHSILKQAKKRYAVWLKNADVRGQNMQSSDLKSQNSTTGEPLL